MANEAPNVIQKDLGLVTAYGYALAGGYTGTEAQFIEDFNALISGQYSALKNKPSINGVELDGDKTSEELGIQTQIVTETYKDLTDLFTSNYGDTYTSILRCGQLTHLTISTILSEDTAIRGGLGLCVATVYSDKDADMIQRLRPKTVGDRYCGILGFEQYGSHSAFDSTLYYPDFWITRDVDGTRVQFHYSVNRWAGDYPTIPSGKVITFSHFFINSCV